MSKNKIELSEPSVTIKPINEAKIEECKNENLRIIHETVLKTVPKDEFLKVNEFAKPALKKLKEMNFPAPFDCMSDVIRVLGALVELGLVASSYQTVKEVYSSGDRICGAVVKYKLASERNFL